VAPANSTKEPLLFEVPINEIAGHHRRDDGEREDRISARPPVQTERTRVPNQSAPKVANSPIDCSALAKPSPTLPALRCIPWSSLWEKIVLNLLSNGFKFTLEGEITVALFEERGYAVLQVRDTGIGIPASEVPLIFDRFHRIESAQRRTHEGTGIGLALVKELLELHRGSVRVESSVGEGSTFTARVPLGFNHLPHDRIDSTRSQVSTATRADAFVSEALRWLPDNTPTGEVGIPCEALPTTRSTAEEPGSVLIVDDNADMRDYLCRILAGTYKIVACSDGEQALLAARRSRPDVVITDIMMPRLDGFGLLRQFRNDTELSIVPVVVLSARAGDEAKIEGLQKAADDYLVKPFSPGELRARVAANIEKGCSIERLRTRLRNARM
jgi:CheY-like chemotaxis protein